MTYVQIDADLYFHPKVLKLDRVARDLFVGAIMYSRKNLTDGFVPVEALRFLDPLTPDPDQALLAANRVRVSGLFRRKQGRFTGYLIHDYARYQQTRAEVEEAREQARIRKQRQRERERSRESHAVTTSVSRRDGRGGVTPVEVEVEEEEEQGFKASTNLEPLPSATDGARAFSDNDIPFALPTDVTEAMP